jgi:hypothetical protein
MTKEERILNPLERAGQVFIIFGMLLVGGYLYLHQVLGTGFFTAGFGPTEKLALYGPIVLSLAAPLIRLVTGDNNLGRLFEALTNLALAAGSFWLIQTFPFDFSHLADPLPAFIRWPIAWIRDPIARAILWIQVVGGVIGGISKGSRAVRHLGE